MELPALVEWKIPHSSFYNKVLISGVMNVKEKIFGPLDFSIENNRCSLDMKNCEKGSTVKFKEICKKFADPSPFYSNLFKNVQPPLKCPIEPGNYSMEQAEVDISFAAFLPIDGYVHISTVKVSSALNGGKTRKIALCLSIETKVVKTRADRSRP